MEWNKIFANYATKKGLISKIYKLFMQLNIRKTNNPNQKMSRRSKYTFLQRRHTDLQKVHELMLSITNHQRNANQIYNEVSLHTNQNVHQGVEKRGTLLHCWWECKLVQSLWKMTWRFLKKLETELPYGPAIQLLAYIWRKLISLQCIIQKYSCTPMVIAALFTIAKTWKQTKCPLTDEWIKM